MGINQMTDTVWHIEKLTRQDGDDRRHKSRCVFYRKNDSHCRKNFCSCIGSAHCKYYREIQKPNSEQGKRLKYDSEPTRLENPFRVSCNVYHKIYGIGTVKAIDGGMLVVAFEGGVEKKLGIEMCVKQGLLKVIEN